MMGLWRNRQVCSISARVYTSLGFCDSFPAFKEWRMCLSSLARDENKVDRGATGKPSSKDLELPDDLLPVVTIVGRPNVGKSALFNRLVKKRQAIVRDTPLGHVTRDYQEGTGILGDLKFLAIDTSGLEPYLPGDSIQGRATMITRQVLQRADVVLFLLDGKYGILPADISVAQWFREFGDGIVNKVLLVANKCERGSKGTPAEFMTRDAEKLGYGETVAISAETGEGMVDLYAALAPKIDPLILERLSLIHSLGSMDTDGEKSNLSHPKVAIMGLTNVGKSTLLNRLLNHERCLTGPEPGLTRDAISTFITHGKDKIELIDTAGWIKKTRLKVHDDSDGAVASQTMREGKTVLRFVHIVVIVIDASRILEREAGLTHAEATLAADVIAQGRALILCLNKVDMASRKELQTVVKLVQKDIEDVTPEVGSATILPMSALNGVGTQELLPKIISAYSQWNRRISTGKLNSWLRKEIVKYMEGGGKDISRIKYLSQVKSRPPTFVAFLSGKAQLGESTQRFIANKLRQQFSLDGVPLRILFRRNLT